MTIIEKTWTRFPGDPIPQEELLELLPLWLQGDRLRLALRLFRNASVSSRHMALHPAGLVIPGRSFARKNDVYKAMIRREIGALTATVKQQSTAAERGSIDLLITASCTGFQIPAMDALIIPALELPASVRRVNLTQHGCAGGAAALGLAHEWLAAHPTSRALVISAELCTLTFQPEDTSGESLVAAAIFGDGAAAVLLAGAEAAPAPRADARLQIRDNYREFFLATEHFLGCDVNEAGLKTILSQDIVPFARRDLSGVFARACERWGIAGPHAFEFGAVHPGGRRMLEILEDVVGLSTAVTQTSWECLQQYGNMSSVSVLAMLHLLEQRPPLRPRAPGVISAFGPGFGAELSLLEACGSPQ